MTLKSKFAQLSSMLQDMEHGLKLNLNSKPSTLEIEALIKKEVSNLKVDILNLMRQEQSAELSEDAFQDK